MSETSRSTVVAIKEETTEGTLIKPTGATDFIANQGDVVLSPNFNLLQSAEVRSSIGETKGAQGLETPTGSLSHYLRGSGTAGTAPNYGLLLKSAFGSTSSNGTERTADSGGAVDSLVLTAGGSDFARGKAVLLKHASNPWEIRPVHSVSSNTLTPGFNFDNAPVAGATAGKCVNYAPANTGHVSFSVWDFIGNGGGIKAMAGAKVTSMTIDIQAGEYINAAYNFEGTSFYFNPIELTSSDTKLDFQDDDGVVVATLVAKIYRDPHELAAAIQTAMRAVQSGETATCVYLDASGKFKITSTGTLLSLLWNSGANTANTIGDKIGFSVAADDTGTAAATGYTSDNAQSWAAYYTPSYDNADALVAKANEIFIGDADDNTCFCAQSVTITLANEKSNIECICADSGVQGSIFNRRTVTVDIVGDMERHNADIWSRYRQNTDTRFCFNFGEKSTDGNWTAGKCGNIYIPTCTVVSFDHGDNEGSVTVEMSLKAFVDSSGNGEVYASFL